MSFFPHAPRQGGRVSLTGSSGSPNLSAQTVVDPSNAIAGWRVDNNGSMQRLVGGSWSDYTPAGGDREWWFPGDVTGIGDDYWIRATLDAGSTPNQLNSGIGSWIQISTTRSWSWIQSSIGSITGTLKFEIATDSGGSNIVATGYYRGTATVEGTS